MSLERKTIRRFFTELLKGRTIALNSVFEMRTEPIRPDVDILPAIVVYTLEEDAVVHTDTPREYGVTLEVAFELFVEEQPETSGKSRDDQLDDLSSQVRSLVGPCIPQLQGLEIESREPLAVNPSKSGFLRTDVDIDSRGRQVIGSERLVYGIYYGLQDDERDVARAVDFELASVTWDFPPPDTVAEARDEIPPASS